MIEVKTKTRKSRKWETVEETWTPESIRDVFGDDSDNLVMALLRKSEELEVEIEKQSITNKDLSVERDTLKLQTKYLSGEIKFWMGEQQRLLKERNEWHSRWTTETTTRVNAEAETKRLQEMIPPKPEGAERLFWMCKPVEEKPFILEED